MTGPNQQGPPSQNVQTPLGLVAPAQSIWTYGVVKSPVGADLVLIQVGTVTGVQIVFLSADEAEGIATQISKIAKQARTGLVLPGSANGNLLNANGSTFPRPAASDAPLSEHAICPICGADEGSTHDAALHLDHQRQNGGH